MGFMAGFPHATNNLVELSTIMQGLRIAKAYNLTPLEIAKNSTEVIRMIANGNIVYESIIYKCGQLMQELGNLVIKHNFSEQNRVANALAKDGAKKKVFENPTLLAVPPIFVLNYVWADILGTSFKNEQQYVIIIVR